MLVLTRRIGERIAIGDDTVLLVRSISGSRVRLAVEAPRNMPVLRGELTVDDKNRAGHENDVTAAELSRRFQVAPLRAYLPSKRAKHG